MQARARCALLRRRYRTYPRRPSPARLGSIRARRPVHLPTRGGMLGLRAARTALVARAAAARRRAGGRGMPRGSLRFGCGRGRWCPWQALLNPVMQPTDSDLLVLSFANQKARARPPLRQCVRGRSRAPRGSPRADGSRLGPAVGHTRCCTLSGRHGCWPAAPARARACRSTAGYKVGVCHTGCVDEVGSDLRRAAGARPVATATRHCNRWQRNIDNSARGRGESPLHRLCLPRCPSPLRASVVCSKQTSPAEREERPPVHIGI
jgi:hypothetical protein